MLRQKIFFITMIFFLAVSNLTSQEYGGKILVKPSLHMMTADFTKPFKLAVSFQIEKNWHLYWKTPGDAGIPPKIKLEFPSGYAHSEFKFPTPKRFDVENIVGYGYSDNLTLITEVTPSSEKQPFSVIAKIKWLVCEEICIPGEDIIRLTEKDLKPDFLNKSKKIIEEAEKKYPKNFSEANITLRGFQLIPQDDNSIRVSFSSQSEREINAFYPDIIKDVSIQYSSIKIEEIEGSYITSFDITKNKKDVEIKNISGLLIQDKLGYSFEIGQYDSSKDTPESSSSGISLWKILLFAFIGGLILNLMPCVLPALSIKILGFTQHAKSGKKSLAMNGIWFSVGVLISFWVLAVVVIALKSAGAQIGWGFQFQSPYFVLALLAVVWIFALNLLGVFEVGGVAVSGKASETMSRNNVVGAFSSGVLTTTLATPCTAPFLSVALGFAFSQSIFIIFLVFSVIAIGLSAPYVILSFKPNWLSFIPKPGEWMNKFKQLMGFLLIATAIWLLSIIGSQLGVDVVYMTLLGIFGLSLALWILGSYIDFNTPKKTKIIVWSIVVAVAFLSSYYVVSNVKAFPQNEAKIKKDGEWLNFSEKLIKEKVNQGKIVFVDFTADWCFTCKVNEKTVIESNTVLSKMKSLGVVKVKADWTNYDPAISKFLKKFERAGVPLYLVYHPNNYGKPIVLPEVITSSMIVEALEGS